MFKLLLLIAAVVSAMGLENASSRRVRSPGWSGWQGRSGYSSTSIGTARSGGGWNNGPAFDRSGGWGSPGYGAHSRSFSNGYGRNGRSDCTGSNGWDDSIKGFHSNVGSNVW